MTRDEYQEIIASLPEKELHSKLWKITRNSDQLPDLAQEVRARALAVSDGKLATFLSAADARKYAYGIVRKVGIDSLNSEKARIAMFIPHDPDTDGVADGRQSPERAAIANEKLQSLVAELKSLPRRTRSAVGHYFIFGDTHRKVAAKLETTEREIHSRLMAATRHFERGTRTNPSLLSELMWKSKKGGPNE